MISVCFQCKPFNMTVIQVYAPTTDAEEVQVDQFYEDLCSKKWQVIPVYLPGKWTREPDGLWSMGLQRVRQLNTHKWRPTTSSRINTKKACPFHHSGLECKSRKSRDTQNNGQVWLWSMKWSKAKTSRVLLREHTGHSKHPFPTTQEVILHIDITRWSIPKSDWLSSFQPKMKKLYTVSKNKT